MRLSSIFDRLFGTPTQPGGLSDQAASHPAPAREDVADHAATEARAEEQDAEEQDAERQYVDAGDLKKSLDKARQALRNAKVVD